jgi:hypothetical protein
VTRIAEQAQSVGRSSGALLRSSSPSAAAVGVICMYIVTAADTGEIYGCWKNID